MNAVIKGKAGLKKRVCCFQPLLHLHGKLVMLVTKFIHLDFLYFYNSLWFKKYICITFYLTLKFTNTFIYITNEAASHLFFGGFFGFDLV